MLRLVTSKLIAEIAILYNQRDPSLPTAIAPLCSSLAKPIQHMIIEVHTTTTMYVMVIQNTEEGTFSTSSAAITRTTLGYI